METRTVWTIEQLNAFLEEITDVESAPVLQVSLGYPFNRSELRRLAIYDELKDRGKVRWVDVPNRNVHPEVQISGQYIYEADGYCAVLISDHPTVLLLDYRAHVGDTVEKLMIYEHQILQVFESPLAFVNSRFFDRRAKVICPPKPPRLPVLEDAAALGHEGELRAEDALAEVDSYFLARHHDPQVWHQFFEAFVGGTVAPLVSAGIKAAGKKIGEKLLDKGVDRALDVLTEKPKGKKGSRHTRRTPRSPK